MIKQVKEIV